MHEALLKLSNGVAIGHLINCDYCFTAVIYCFDVSYAVDCFIFFFF